MKWCEDLQMGANKNETMPSDQNFCNQGDIFMWKSKMHERQAWGWIVGSETETETAKREQCSDFDATDLVSGSCGNERNWMTTVEQNMLLIGAEAE